MRNTKKTNMYDLCRMFLLDSKSAVNNELAQLLGIVQAASWLSASWLVNCAGWAGGENNLFYFAKRNDF